MRALAHHCESRPPGTKDIAKTHCLGCGFFRLKRSFNFIFWFTSTLFGLRHHPGSTSSNVIENQYQCNHARESGSRWCNSCCTMRCASGAFRRFHEYKKAQQWRWAFIIKMPTIGINSVSKTYLLLQHLHWGKTKTLPFFG